MISYASCSSIQRVSYLVMHCWRTLSFRTKMLNFVIKLLIIGRQGGKSKNSEENELFSYLWMLNTTFWRVLGINNSFSGPPRGVFRTSFTTSLSLSLSCAPLPPAPPTAISNRKRGEESCYCKRSHTLLPDFRELGLDRLVQQGWPLPGLEIPLIYPGPAPFTHS